MQRICYNHSAQVQTIVVLGPHAEDLAESLLREMFRGKQKEASWSSPRELLVTSSLFDPHAAPARGEESIVGNVTALDVNKMLLDSVTFI